MRLLSFRIYALILGICIFTSATCYPISISSGEGTNILVDPDQTELGIGETFNTKVRILNVENLYGLDISLGWDTTLLNYMNHTVTIPIESHLDGILHEPELEIKNEVNHTSGTYWIAYTSLSPAEPFSGSGVVVEITFEAIAFGICDLTILSSDLADFGGSPINHVVTHASIIVHDFLHDIAITDLSVGKIIVGEGYCTNINVSVVNQGAFPEDFNVTLHANGITIDETSVNLAAGNSDTISFVWNTTGWSKGNYVLGASVPPVTNEIDTFDNDYTDGFVFLTIPGDVDGDCDVDLFDTVAIATTYGCHIDDLLYDPVCDIDDDGSIGVFDIVIACDNYGEDWQSPGNGGDIGFEDDFESYAVGAFPGAWTLFFNGAGDAYQIVVDHVSVSPTRSLQLKGASGWAADAIRYFDNDSSTISFEVYVRVDEVLGTSEHTSRVGFWSLKPNGWARWYYPVVFFDDGTIKCGGQLLQSYEAGLWYKVKQVFDRDANVLSVWINDVLQGSDIPGPTTYSGYGIQAFALSGRYTGIISYYDDVKLAIEP